MDFNVLSIPRRKSTLVELHSPSCTRSDRLKQKPGITLRKIRCAYVEDAVATLTTEGTKPVVHPRCCKLFHKPATTNPACPHCRSASTVFASNIGLGKKEFTCTKCKKLFTIESKEKTMKIKVSKTSRTKARAEKKTALKAARLATREQRKTERTAKRAERLELRKQRMAVRLRKTADRLKRYGIDTKDFIAFLDAQMPLEKTKKAKTTIKKVVKKTKARKTAPKKTVAVKTTPIVAPAVSA